MNLVIKYGGSVLAGDDPVLDAVALHDGDVVVVHGGGPQIGEAMAQAGVPSKFIDGLRSTPPAAMPIVARVVGDINAKLVRALEARGRPARGVDGRTDGLLVAERAVGKDGQDLGCVGRAVGANAAVVEAMWRERVTPVVAPLCDVNGNTCNVNADEVAGALAGALGVPAIFVTDVPGVVLNGAVCPRLGIDDVAAAVADGRIRGGMIPKTSACVAALRMGAPFAAIVGATAKALDGATGTRVVAR